MLRSLNRLAAIVAAFLLGLTLGLSMVPLSAAIRSSKIAGVADSSDPTKIQPSDLDPFTQPGTPVDRDIWIERSGATPNRLLKLWVYDNGAWRPMTSTTY